jgi:gliding motility-associated-like protein
MLRKLTFLLVSILCTFYSISGIPLENEFFACAVDVQILEGTSVSFCQGSFGTINASAGFVSYAWTGPQTGSSPSLAPTVSGQYVVTAIDGIGCISTDTIDVTIHTNPVGIIVSSEGNLICPGSTGSTLSLTQTYASYLWGNGSSNPTIQITQGGTYVVQVTDFNGCLGNSSITISQPNFSLSTIGPATVCNGTAATLVATGGTSYVWSTGESGATIVVSPTASTDYQVTITNGSCIQTLSQTISYIQMPYSEFQDTFFIAEGDRVFINGPSDYTSYTWTPQQDLTQYNAQGAVFGGSASIQYTVNSVHTNGCMRSDDIWVIVVKLTIPTGFSPNNDGINDVFVIPELEDYKSKLSVFNRWGDLVYENENYQNDWNGTCQAGMCLGQGPLPEGTYFYSIDIQDVHFDGFTTLKR